jgi:AcrR family transcriptional regulator
MPTAARTSKDDPKTESIEDRILDAALVQFQRLGVKKTTIEDVARQAEVDRVTVYRRIGSREDLVRAVTAREVQGVLTELRELPGQHDSIESVVAAVFVTVVTRWRTHPLVERMIALEPGRLLPQLTTDGASFFTMASTASAAILHRALHDRGLPEIPDLSTRAEIACRIVHSLILQPVGTIPLDTRDDLDAFARAYIVPLVVG